MAATGAIRNLCRARVDAVDDLRRAKNRLSGLLRRLGHRYAGAATWSEALMRYLRDPKISVNLSKRQEGQPRWIKDISWKAQNRLNARYKTLQKRLMHYNKIKVSIARELTGVIWEIGFKMNRVRYRIST